MRTHRIHLYIIQQWGAHEAPSQHLHLPEPLPAGRVPRGRALEEHAGIIRVARRTRAQAQQHAPKPLVAEVQVVAQVPLERRAVQERDEQVDAREKQVDEMVDQVWLWKVVTGRVEAEGGALPLWIL